MVLWIPFFPLHFVTPISQFPCTFSILQKHTICTCHRRLIQKPKQLCFLIRPIFRIYQKGKVTFSLVISLERNAETSSMGLAWPLWPTDVWPSLYDIHTGLPSQALPSVWRKGIVSRVLYHSHLSYQIYDSLFFSVILARCRLFY